MTQKGDKGRNRIGEEGKPRWHEMADRNGWCGGAGGCVTHRFVVQVEAEVDAQTRRTEG